MSSNFWHTSLLDTSKAMTHQMRLSTFTARMYHLRSGFNGVRNLPHNCNGSSLTKHSLPVWGGEMTACCVSMTFALEASSLSIDRLEAKQIRKIAIVQKSSFQIIPQAMSGSDGSDFLGCSQDVFRRNDARRPEPFCTRDNWQSAVLYLSQVRYRNLQLCTQPNSKNGCF